MKKTLYTVIVLLTTIILFTQCKKEDPVVYTTVDGYIINSQTGGGLANAKLSFCKPFTHLKSTEASTPEVVFTVTTDGSGYYKTTQAIVGTYTLMIEATGYFTAYYDNYAIVAGLVTTTLPQVTLAQTLSANSQLRIVLTWGSSPYDLDSHLTGPIAGSTSKFHVYFSDETYPSSSLTPIIKLDVDDTSSFGPETITINSWTAGTYRYSVFNYSEDGVIGASQILASPASVKVYGQSGLLKSYTPPTATATSGNTWVVFEITATANGAFTITDKNTWAFFTDSYVVTKK